MNERRRQAADRAEADFSPKTAICTWCWIRRSPHPSSTAVYVALAGIGMIFAALTSALIVRKGGSTDWKSFTLPSVLYVNTLVLLASGFVLEVGRRAVGKFMTAPERQHAKPTFWFYLLLAWDCVCRRSIRCMAATSPRRLYLATNPSGFSSTCLRSRMPCTCWVDLEGWCSSSPAAPPHLTEEHVECSFAILAFHGCPVDLSVVFALVHYLTGRCRSEKLERG